MALSKWGISLKQNLKKFIMLRTYNFKHKSSGISVIFNNNSMQSNYTLGKQNKERA